MPVITPGAQTSSLAEFSTYATFQPSSGMFSPGLPPVPPDPQPVRVTDFPTGVNLNWTPRAYETFGFPALRSFANVELVRLAIETRKDQIERLDWRVKKIGAKRTDPTNPEIKAATKLLRKPDGQHHFAVWLRMVIEDLLVLDSPAIERRRSRNGKLIGLDVVDGGSIKVLVDQNGRRPITPEPAYQQVIKGRVWTNLTTEDLIYEPRNRRSNHLYGFGPVEQIIVTINTLLQRQAAQLAHFTASNIPAGILNAAEGWTPDQIKDFQDWMNAILSGNTTERSKLLWVPSGTKYQSFKEAPIKDEFDEWLARIVAFAFSLPPTPFIKQMNRTTSESDQDRAMQEGLSPLLMWAKRFLDDVIQDDLGFDDLEFSWESPADIDPATQSDIDDRDVKNGKKTLNEIRDGAGLDPYPNPLANEPLIYTANGYVPLTAYQDNRQDKENNAKALAATAPNPDEAESNAPDEEGNEP
ncbi:phage portal protein [Rhizobium rhizogenes]|uniref:phage portal protein n=1 Tax=Rhizobium rhizogenes TaxID=359 RepID=UPI001573CE9B|nr:phage portal protein [Rhizobium rhizogenes]NTF67964.1 phage portal protein [Rhizobium rhizogenes]